MGQTAVVDRLRHVPGRRDPDRPVEGARQVDRDALGDPYRGQRTADLRELHGGGVAHRCRGLRILRRSRRSRPLRAERRFVPAAPSSPPMSRPAARPAPGAPSACRRSTAVSTDQLPLASTRIRASGPTASLTAITCATSPSMPAFSLKVSKPRAAHSRARRRHRVGIGRRRVALQRTGPAEVAPSSRHTGTSDSLPTRSNNASFTACRACRRELRHAPHVVLGVPGEALADELRAPQRVQLLDDQGERHSSAQRQRRRLTEALGAVGAQPQQRHLALLQPSARGHVGLAERQRERDHLERLDACSGPGHESRRPADRSSGEQRQQRPGACKRAVQRGPVGARGDGPHERQNERRRQQGKQQLRPRHRSRRSRRRSRTAASP